MPTIVWLIAGAGVWLAAAGAICMVLTVAKRADAAADGDWDASRARRRERAGHDPASLLGPPISAITVGAREPGRTRPISASAPGGPGPRPRRPPPGSTEADRPGSGHSYALHLRDARVAQLRWRADPAGWYLRERRGGWRRLAVDPELDAGAGLTARRHARPQTAELVAWLSTALALDAAADVLHGPPASSPR